MSGERDRTFVLDEAKETRLREQIQMGLMSCSL